MTDPDVDSSRSTSTAESVSPVPAVRVDGGAPGRMTGAVVFVMGVLGLLAATTLTIDKFKILLDPEYRPSCSINPVLSCGSVMVTKQAEFFGFPNPIIGIAAFAVVVVTGVLALANVRLPIWYWVGLALGLAAGMVFVVYLITQSIYRINALCPYCMVVWTVTPVVLVIATQTAARLSDVVIAWRITDWLWPVLVVYYLVVVLLIAEHFWYYWSTLL